MNSWDSTGVNSTSKFNLDLIQPTLSTNVKMRVLVLASFLALSAAAPRQCTTRHTQHLRVAARCFHAQDRYNPSGHAAPVCVQQQISTTLAGAVAADGSITATWTRPLSAAGVGLAPIVPGQTYRAIAAWGSSNGRQNHTCAPGWPEHSTTGSAQVTF